MSRRIERGVALLEVVIALAILGIAGLSAVGALLQASDQIEHIAAVERRIEDQSRLLSAIGLLTRDDLLRQLGRRTAGQYTVRTQRLSDALFQVTVADGPDMTPTLATVFYRPGETR
jgi:prepilin-type N-terminal cleavage/methylation domain-containing protein